MPSAPDEEPPEEQLRRMTPVSIPPDQLGAMQALRQLLAEATRRRGRGRKVKLVGTRGQCAPVPDTVFCVLERVAELLARGDAVTIVPVAQELTTQQAADLLGVSRQYLVRLLDEGQIPHTKTGTHRRLRLPDVLAYKKVRDAKRSEQLDELTRLGQEYGGYPERE
jgi:excisionase family DNA binding protein